MSANKLINAVIALVEDRPKDAREMLRSPEMRVSVGEVQNRLFTAIRKREVQAQVAILKQILSTTLRLEIHTGPEEEAYAKGIADVEEIIDHVISELES
jgi:hypothetical protein